MNMTNKSVGGAEEDSLYPPDLIERARNSLYCGRLNDPTSSAYLKGPCGDEMEFYLVIMNNIIEDVRFFTNGCIATVLCGDATARSVMGKTVFESLSISPKQVMDELKGLPAENSHCTILAVSTFYKAIADYLLKP